MQPVDPSHILSAALWDMKGFLAFFVVLMVALAVLKAFKPRIKGWAGERAVKRILDGGGYMHLHDLYLPSRDGITQVDHVAMVGRVILVIETKNYEGWIFGDERQAQWTVSLAGGRVRHRFQNPLRQNHGHIKAVKAVVGPGVDVQGLVVFTGGAKFPKGIPAGVVQIGELRALLRDMAQQNSGSVMTVWAKLDGQTKVTNRAASGKAHMDTVRQAKARAR